MVLKMRQAIIAWTNDDAVNWYMYIYIYISVQDLYISYIAINQLQSHSCSF